MYIKSRVELEKYNVGVQNFYWSMYNNSKLLFSYAEWEFAVTDIN
jgi:hypothetical protein